MCGRLVHMNSMNRIIGLSEGQSPSLEVSQSLRELQAYKRPELGGTAPRWATRTAAKLAGFALSHLPAIRSKKWPSRYLDVGCGNGFITEKVAQSFDEVVGIDVEPDRLGDFRLHAPAGPIHTIKEMSAEAIGFTSEYFSLVTAFEVLEHVADLEASVREIVRVCRPGGLIVVSVPQVWFPFENHGMRVGKATYNRKVPLLPYLRPLHKRYSLARVFSSAQLDQLFLPLGTHVLATGYVAPQFERAASNRDSWERKLRFIRPLLDRCESVPLLRCLTGVSMLKAYLKRI